MQWNLAELREDVTKLYGREQCDKLRPSLRSLEERSYFARFHYHEAMDGMDAAIGDRDGSQVLDELMFSNDEAAEQFRSARLDAVANIVACLQSLHATADTLAHVVYFGLGMDRDSSTKLEERDVQIGRVTDKLRRVSDCASVVQLLDELKDGPDYKYFAAIVNHSKHRAIVDVLYSISTEEPGRKGLKLHHFQYAGKDYQARWLDETLPPEYDRQSLLRVKIGRELNQIVAQRLAAA